MFSWFNGILRLWDYPSTEFKNPDGKLPSIMEHDTRRRYQPSYQTMINQTQTPIFFFTNEKLNRGCDSVFDRICE